MGIRFTHGKNRSFFHPYMVEHWMNAHNLSPAERKSYTPPPSFPQKWQNVVAARPTPPTSSAAPPPQHTYQRLRKTPAIDQGLGPSTNCPQRHQPLVFGARTLFLRFFVHTSHLERQRQAARPGHQSDLALSVALVQISEYPNPEGDYLRSKINLHCKRRTWPSQHCLVVFAFVFCSRLIRYDIFRYRPTAILATFVSVIQMNPKLRLPPLLHRIILFKEVLEDYGSHRT